MSMTRMWRRVASSLALMILAAAPACAQDYPSKPVKIIVSLGPPQEFAAFIAAERQRWSEVIRKADIHLEQ